MAVTLSFSDLVEETLATLYRHVERPRLTAVGSSALASSSSTTFTVTDPEHVAVTDLLEFVSNGEQVLVTGKSDLDVLTVARRYNNTTGATGHATTDWVEINPQFGRQEVDRWVRRFYDTVANRYFPNVLTAAMYRDPGEAVVTMPAGTISVLQVRAQALTGEIADIGGWELERFVPSSIYASGNVLRVPSTVSDDDELWVTYTGPYDTTGTDIDVPVGTDDLAVLFASAYAVARREVSRMDLDSIQEWNQDAAIRNGQNLRLIRELWGEFYRRVDEARATYHVPKHRPYRKMPKVR